VPPHRPGRSSAAGGSGLSKVSTKVISFVLLLSFIGGAAFAALRFLSPRPAYAQVEATTLVVLKGQVRIESASGATSVPTSPVGLRATDRVQTAADGYGSVTFFDGSTTGLEPTTLIELRTLDQAPDSGQRIVFHQERGKTWNRVPRLLSSSGQFEVTTPVARLKSQVAEFRIQVESPDQTTVEVISGSILASSVGATSTPIIVEAGFRTTMERDLPPAIPTRIPPPDTALRVEIDGPVTPFLTDQNHRSVGFQPQVDVFAGQIPGATHTVEGGRQVVTIPNPTAQSDLILKGQGGGGVYQVSVSAMVGGRPAAWRRSGLARPLGDPKFQGDIAPGQLLGLNLSINGPSLHASDPSSRTGPPDGSFVVFTAEQLGNARQFLPLVTTETVTSTTRAAPSVSTTRTLTTPSSTATSSGVQPPAATGTETPRPTLTMQPIQVFPTASALVTLAVAPLPAGVEPTLPPTGTEISLDERVESSPTPTVVLLGATATVTPIATSEATETLAAMPLPTQTQTLIPPLPSATNTPGPTDEPMPTVTPTSVTPTSELLTPTATPVPRIEPPVHNLGPNPRTPSATATSSVLATRSATPTAIHSAVPSPTASLTPPLTLSRTLAPTPGPTGTSTPTSTRIPTMSATATPSDSPTLTASAAPSYTLTVTITPSATFTTTNTPSSTPTSVPSATPTATLTTTSTPSSATLTQTATVTSTSTHTATPTATPSATPTITLTGTATSTVTATSTATASATVTVTTAPLDVYWISPISGFWHEGSNWSTGAPPGINDNVFINMPGVTVTFSDGGGSTTVRSLTSQNAFVISNGTLLLTTASTINNTFTITGGGLRGAGDLTVAGLFTWTSGELGGNSILHANGGSRLNGTLLKTFFGRTVNLAGTSTWQDGTVYSGNGTNVINILAGATFVIQSDRAMGIDSGSLALNNAGTLSKVFTTGTTEIEGNFTNTGLVLVQTGYLRFLGTVTQTSGVTRIENGATLANRVNKLVGTIALNGGALIGDGAVVANVSNSGNVRPENSDYGAGTLTIYGNYTQSAGGTLEVICDTTDYPSVVWSTLLVEGAANLAGTLSVDVIGNTQPDVGTTGSVILQSTGSGSFSAIVDNSPDRAFTPTYQPNAVILTVLPKGTVLLGPGRS
jgi:hypothetical protein